MTVLPKNLEASLQLHSTFWLLITQRWLSTTESYRHSKTSNIFNKLLGISRQHLCLNILTVGDYLSGKVFFMYWADLIQQIFWTRMVLAGNFTYPPCILVYLLIYQSIASSYQKLSIKYYIFCLVHNINKPVPIACTGLFFFTSLVASSAGHRPSYSRWI